MITEAPPKQSFVPSIVPRFDALPPNSTRFPSEDSFRKHRRVVSARIQAKRLIASADGFLSFSERAVMTRQQQQEEEQKKERPNTARCGEVLTRNSGSKYDHHITNASYSNGRVGCGVDIRRKGELAGYPHTLSPHRHNNDKDSHRQRTCNNAPQGSYSSCSTTLHFRNQLQHHQRQKTIPPWTAVQTEALPITKKKKEERDDEDDAVTSKVYAPFHYMISQLHRECMLSTACSNNGVDAVTAMKEKSTKETSSTYPLPSEEINQERERERGGSPPHLSGRTPQFDPQPPQLSHRPTTTTAPAVNACHVSGTSTACSASGNKGSPTLLNRPATATSHSQQQQQQQLSIEQLMALYLPEYRAAAAAATGTPVFKLEEASCSTCYTHSRTSPKRKQQKNENKDDSFFAYSNIQVAHKPVELKGGRGRGRAPRPCTGTSGSTRCSRGAGVSGTSDGALEKEKMKKSSNETDCLSNAEQRRHLEEEGGTTYTQGFSFKSSLSKVPCPRHLFLFNFSNPPEDLGRW